ncbi:hypothetical protein [Haloarchaeobius sp. TZWSO28]|uniref:hypothetical protein n=1 Tax=Haloarchaeobius sp. TZWSO28 TaxID=3446119 RepID=UPI003EC0B2E4
MKQHSSKQSTRRTLLKTIGTGLLTIGVGSQAVAASDDGGYRSRNFRRNRRSYNTRGGYSRSNSYGGRGYSRSNSYGGRGYGRSNSYGHRSGPSRSFSSGNGPAGSQSIGASSHNAPAPYYGSNYGPYYGGSFEFDHGEIEVRGDILAGGFEYERDDYTGDIEFESAEIDFEYDYAYGDMEFETFGRCDVIKFEVEGDDLEADFGACY